MSTAFVRARQKLRPRVCRDKDKSCVPVSCPPELVKEKLGSDLLDTQLAYSIRFYCMGAVGMTQEWVLNDNITSAETVVQMMFNSMPENLRRILF